MDDRPVAALPTVGRGRGRGVRGDSRSGKRGGSTATADTDAYRVPQEKADNIPGSDTNVRSPNTERKRGRGTSSVVGGSTRGRGRGKPSNNKPTESLSKDSEAEPSHDLSKEKASNLTGWGTTHGAGTPKPVPRNNKKPNTKKTANQRVSEISKGHSSLTTNMIAKIMSNSYECMVCFEMVGRKAAIWTCSECFQFFHIRCAARWASNSAQNDPTKGNNWSCPNCRAQNTSMPVASCFCGKVKAYDVYALPHSCGDECGRKRKSSSCPHACVLACHPGPCPSCSAMGPLRHCFCGRTSKLCGEEDKNVSCGKECGKMLNCGKHYCAQPCHGGPCSACSVMVDSKCYCGKLVKQLACGTESQIDLSNGKDDPRTFSCKEKCERTLACGHHKCHPSESADTLTCPPCPLLPSAVTTCACGSTEISKWPARTSCTDPIPTCTHTCGEKLKCGRHTCEEKCHTGECAQRCTKTVTIPCACGFNAAMGAKTLPCYEVYPDNYNKVVSENRCKHTCGVMKECGKHHCSVKCCPSRDPEGYHICRITCNKKLSCGNHTCPLTCHRGRCPPCHLIVSAEDRLCPCGKTVHEAPITCGSTPPVCKYNCPIPRPCGHNITPHACHWTGGCPDCVVLTDKLCAGGHMTLKVPCYRSEVFCGRTCGKAMHCNHHICKRKCHSGPCEIPIEEREDKKEGSHPSCGQQCSRKLRTCSHECQALCHPGSDCPIVECKQKSRIFCDCGRKSEDLSCVGLKHVSLPCDDTCLRELRQKKLTAAFYKPPVYPELLINLCRAVPTFIRNVERNFAKFLQSPDTTLRMPPMDAIQRQAIHELAKFYLIDTDSAGVEPHRYVQLLKRAGSHVPSALLSQVVEIYETTHKPTPSVALANVTSTVEDLEADSVLEQDASADVQTKASNSENIGEATTTTTTTSTQSPPAGKYVPGPVRKRASTVLIYGLNRAVNNTHLEEFLKDFQGFYTIQWIDVENVLVIFDSQPTAHRALNELATGPFRMKPYIDSNPNGGTVVAGPDNMISLGDSSQPTPSTYVVPGRRKQAEASGSDQNVSNIYQAEHAVEKSQGFKMANTAMKAKMFQGPEGLVISANPWALLDQDGSEGEEDWEDLVETKEENEAQG